jgi:type IV secretion system protein VirD4
MDSRQTRPVRNNPLPAGLSIAAGMFAMAALVNWLAAQASWWASTGHRMHRSLSDSLHALVGLRRHPADPAAAWSTASNAGPGAFVYYGAAAVIVLGLAAVAVSLRRLVIRSTTSRHSRGARWANATDVRALRVGRRRRGRRLVLGRLPGLPIRKFVATEARHSVLVLGPTQSGKTSGLAIPALLEWSGPAVATSVKDDLARNTAAWRSTRAPVWMFDPTATSGLGPLACWSPLELCRGWTSSQRTASWLVDATPARTGMADAAFWYAAAAKQLAPLLLAASSSGFTMAEIVRWTNTADFAEPGQLLQIAGEEEAAIALTACEARDERIRSSVATTLETVLAPFEDPTVAAWTSHTDFSLDELFESSGTVYLCGPSHEQSRVQGVFSALVSSVIAAAVDRVARTGRPLDPPLLLVLDEAANIAPVRDLDTVASTCAALGVQLVTVCQDLSQLTSRYGNDRARTIVNNHRAKLLLSGVSDLPTLDLLSGLAGEEAVREESYTVDQSDGRRSRSSAVAFRRLLPADRLRRLPPGEGILVYGHLAPIRLHLRPWFTDRELRRRGGGWIRSGPA